MRRLVLSLFACLSVVPVDTRAAEPAKIELMLLKTMTVTEEQFLLGAQDGRPVTLAAELRLPTAGTARLPAMILLHGSGVPGAPGKIRLVPQSSTLFATPGSPLVFVVDGQGTPTGLLQKQVSGDYRFERTK